MKKILWALLAIPVLTISCNGEEKKETEKEKKEIKKDTASEEVTQTSKEHKQIILIEDDDTVSHLKYHDVAQYRTNLHPSTGEEVKINIEDTSIVKLTGSEFEYDTKERPIEPGGDAGQKTFSFKALTPGETHLTITKIFQGEVQREQQIKIVVLPLQKSGGDQE